MSTITTIQQLHQLAEAGRESGAPGRTRHLSLGTGILADLGQWVSEHHARSTDLVICDAPTWAAAGEAVEAALVAAGRPWNEAYAFASGLIPPIRGLSSPDTSAYALAELALDLASASPRLSFELGFAHDSAARLDASELRAVLATIGNVTDARVTGTAPRFHVELTLAPSPAPPETSESESSLQTRLRELLPDLSPVERSTLAGIAARITQTASTGPVFLTAVRPVVAAKPADRQYDFFFSMQAFMIVTEILGLLVLALIIHLEKRGVIRRVGALEDANR